MEIVKYERADYLPRAKKAYRHRIIASIPEPADASSIQEFNGFRFVVLRDGHGAVLSVSKILPNGRLRLRRRWPKDIENPEPTLDRALELERQSRRVFESFASGQSSSNGSGEAIGVGDGNINGRNQ